MKKPKSKPAKIRVAFAHHRMTVAGINYKMVSRKDDVACIPIGQPDGERTKTIPQVAGFVLGVSEK